MRARLVVILLRGFSYLSLGLSHRLGAIMGWVVSIIPSNYRYIAETNIRLCYPEKTPLEHRRILRESLQETGKAVTELGALWHWPTDRVLPLIRQVDGLELMAAAMDSGQGVILAAPHLGAWEILGVYCASQWPMTNLYRPPHLAGLDKTIRHSRERYGSSIVPTDVTGVKALLKALKRGELIGILPDQEPARDSGVFAPFYGISAYTMTLLSRLAQKSAATVLFGYAERLPAGEGYRLQFLPAPEGIASRDAEQAATSLNTGVATCINHLPTQYQWAYKRFKSRPEGVARRY